MTLFHTLSCIQLPPVFFFLFYFLPLSFMSDFPVITSTFASCPLPPHFISPSSSLQVQSTSWMPHQQYVMQPTVSSSTHFETAFSLRFILLSMPHYLLNTFLCASTRGMQMSVRLSACLWIHSLHTLGGNSGKCFIPVNLLEEVLRGADFQTIWW